MRKPGLSLLMVAGLLAVCDPQSVRQFRYVGLAKNWSDARTYCRERFSDLATIQNAANSTEAQQAAGTSQFWIGLFNGTWRWSQDENQLNPTNTLFTLWNTNEPQSGLCVTISKTGFWSTKDCRDPNYFLCYNAPNARNVLVSQKMSWSDAQAYCRSTHTDLSTIRNAVENTAMTLLLPVSTTNFLSILSGTTSTSSAWIGLHRSGWVWSDGSSASYRPWDNQASIEQANCVTMDSATGTWFRRPCSESYTFLCSTDVSLVPSMMRAVKIRLNAGSADLNDPAVKESILQELRQRMKDQGVTEEVKLRWRIQRDGKVFHLEDKRAPPGVCEAETCDTV